MSYTTCQVDIEKDKDDILRLWRHNQPKPLDEKYAWIYEGNPAGKAKVWMVKHSETGECVGITALFQRKFSVKGESIVAWIAGDFLVNQLHRTMGPAIMLQRSIISAVEKKDMEFIYGFPNKAAEPIMKRVGFRSIGSLTRLVKILKTTSQLRKLGLHKYWIRLLSPFLDFALKLISVETWYRTKKGFVCEELKDFDERFDQLWAEERLRFAAAGERTASFLRWKYLEDPDDANKVFGVFDSSGSVLKGYIVYCFKENSIEIRDFIFSPDRKAIRVLMTCFLRHARSIASESIVIRFLENNNITKKMKRFGFIKRKSSGNVYFYCNDLERNKKTLFGNADSWLLMRSDEDT